VPYVNGTFAMTTIPPLQGYGVLNLGLFYSTSFTTYPDVGGVFESGANMTVDIPATILLGLVNGLTITATNQDGSDPVVIGSVSSLIGGLSGEVAVPINTPLTLKSKLLVLTITSVLGVDLNLSGGYLTVTLNGLAGKPSNAQ
jgi:hypothetical protein